MGSNVWVISERAKRRFSNYLVRYLEFLVFFLVLTIFLYPGSPILYRVYRVPFRTNPKYFCTTKPTRERQSPWRKPLWWWSICFPLSICFWNDQERMKGRIVSPHLIPRIIPLKLFLDMVPSSSADVIRAFRGLFTKCSEMNRNGRKCTAKSFYTFYQQARLFLHVYFTKHPRNHE